jgi:hypothetical protein
MDPVAFYLFFGLCIFAVYYSRRLIKELEHQREQHMDRRILQLMRREQRQQNH